MLSTLERRVEHRQPRRRGLRGFERFALHALHAARAAPEQQADFVVGPVALVNAHFLAFAPGKVHQLGGNGQAGGSARAASGSCRAASCPARRDAKRVFHHRIIGAADFERAFARAHVQAGFAGHFAFQNQLADEFQLGL
jgi:hypothetical protein